MATTADFLIIGGGIIGLAIARELRGRYPEARLLLIDKEARLGAHASGRNSGVLHAGFYYSADSLKARFTRDGNRLLTTYALEHRLKLNRCGKLVVAKTAPEVEGLKELKRRGDVNGVETHLIDLNEARGLEPRVKSIDLALWSPTAATVDPSEIVQALAREAQAKGLIIMTNTPYLGRQGRAVKTPRGLIEAGYVINASGLYADKIAQEFGLAQRYRILPFKGLYLYSSEPPGALSRHIYPVPDLHNPFLGVHLTVTVDGHVKIGPTAIPAFWREHYDGLANFKLFESLSILRDEVALFIRNDFGFRQLAVTELKKYARSHLVAQAAELATGVSMANFRRWGRPGIRAQLYDRVARKLVTDFVIEQDSHSLHVLNAVSPAFTAALPFAAYVVDRLSLAST
ncbi:MAG: L-2-hydroxyglutarate oxidase [Truepera sp.]|nr:L-2-hydroxyglutarate oxidase [Truepera sp.]